MSQFVHECYEKPENGEPEPLPEQHEITVQKIRQAGTGEKNGRKWTKYLLETSDGKFFTFDGGFEVGRTYGIEYKTDQYGRTITKKIER